MAGAELQADREIYHKENLSLRTRKRVKRPSHARIIQAGPDAQTNNGQCILYAARLWVGDASELWQLPICEIVQAPRSKWICRSLEFSLCVFLKDYAFKVGCRSVSRSIPETL